MHGGLFRCLGGFAPPPRHNVFNEKGNAAHRAGRGQPWPLSVVAAAVDQLQRHEQEHYVKHESSAANGLAHAAHHDACDRSLAALEHKADHLDRPVPCLGDGGEFCRQAKPVHPGHTAHAGQRGEEQRQQGKMVVVLPRRRLTALAPALPLDSSALRHRDEGNTRRGQHGRACHGEFWGQRFFNRALFQAGLHAHIHEGVQGEDEADKAKEDVSKARQRRTRKVRGVVGGHVVHRQPPRQAKRDAQDGKTQRPHPLQCHSPYPRLAGNRGDGQRHGQERRARDPGVGRDKAALEEPPVHVPEEEQEEEEEEELVVNG